MFLSPEPEYGSHSISGTDWTLAPGLLISQGHDRVIKPLVATLLRTRIMISVFKHSITCADGSIASSLGVRQQLIRLRLDAAQAQLQLGQLSQGVLVVLQLLADPWGETLKRDGSLYAPAQPLKSLSEQGHPLIQLEVQEKT